MIRPLFLAMLVLAMAGCQQAPSPAPPEQAAAPAATSPAAPPPAEAAVVAKSNLAVPSREFLPGPLYFCESSSGRKAIEYEPRVEQLCRRHPEMGPCQYERDQCRAKGGRVFTARNEEVTKAVEAEYDRVVRRVRFQADGGKK